MDGPCTKDERAALLALLEELGAVDSPKVYTAWSTIAAEVVRRGSATTLWDELHPLTLDGLRESDAALARARDRLAEWRGADFELLTVLDGGYPLQLRRIHPIPPLLFVKGRLAADEVGVSIVGSREVSSRGRRMAADIARGLVKRGIAVISGLAAGVDTAAHEATLSAGGRPVAVLGTGITRAYPKAGRALHDQVGTTGALVSQFLPDCSPAKHTLRLRNATMAGLSCASVVVEAAEYSGSRVHARYATQSARPLILADAVAETTRWGRELLQQPGVYVASGTAEVLRIVEEVACDIDVGA
ncbi:DNA-processing protein DprA [Mycobacterium branderi]|nr:DNA-processing protein DprA [Mycobacterium branderi]MCV7234572.1 DNA-processing protein DprA [Mycobacterium branderi]ORA33123.1 hypothetical protein BST20_22945 [Mycobacterium branderi]